MEQSKNVVYLMRHAESEMNNAMKSELNKDGSNYFDIALRPEICDALLTSKGLEQCQSQRDFLEKLGIKKVYCSPMRRAIMTALEA